MIFMAESDDYRKLLDEKFNGIYTKLNLHYESITKTLNNIEIQTTKHNGRMVKIEEEINNLKLNDAKHSYNCPQNSRFTKLEEAIEQYKKEQEDKLLEYNFIKKYPKSFIAGIAVIVVLLLLSYNIGLTSFKNTEKQQVKVENTK